MDSTATPSGESMKVLARKLVLVVLLGACHPGNLLHAQGQDAANKDTLLLESLGSIAGSHLYQSYLNIGFIADGKEEGLYDEKEMQGILTALLSSMTVVDGKLAKLEKLKLTKEDRDAIAQIRKLSAVLRNQAAALQAYWKTGDEQQADQYQKHRQEAWAGISKLLGLN